MFDLNEQPKLPTYELKTRDGETKSFDAVLVSYELTALEGVKEPAKIQEIVNRVFEIDVDALDAMQIIEDFAKFEEEHLEEPLKKVFGRGLSSATSTGSRRPSSRLSVQRNSSG